DLPPPVGARAAEAVAGCPGEGVGPVPRDPHRARGCEAHDDGDPGLIGARSDRVSTTALRNDCARVSVHRSESRSQGVPVSGTDPAMLRLPPAEDLAPGARLGELQNQRTRGETP